MVAVLVSLSGLIGLLATGFSFGRILAGWFTATGFGMLALVALFARYGTGRASGEEEHDWIRRPVDAALEDRLFSTREAMTIAVGPEPKACGLLIGASLEVTRNMQTWVRELDRDSMTCHDLGIARGWIAEHTPLFDYVVVDGAGMGIAATAEFCRNLRDRGSDLPIIMMTPFPTIDLPTNLADIGDIHIVPFGKVAIKLAILSVTEPQADEPGQAHDFRNRVKGGNFQIIHGDRT